MNLQNTYTANTILSAGPDAQKTDHVCKAVLKSRWVLANILKDGYRNPTGFRRWVKVVKNQKLLYTHGMGTWKSKNRHKYLLQYHIIFVCKYRKKLPVSRQISDDIKQFSYEICQRHSVIIRYMEKISPIFTKTILERTYLLERWIFCL